VQKLTTGEGVGLPSNQGEEDHRCSDRSTGDPNGKGFTQNKKAFRKRQTGYYESSKRSVALKRKHQG